MPGNSGNQARAEVLIASGSTLACAWLYVVAALWLMFHASPAHVAVWVAFIGPLTCVTVSFASISLGCAAWRHYYNKSRA